MATTIHHPPDDQFEWREAISQNGNPFMIGVSRLRAEGIREAAASRHPTANVNWEVDNRWHDTPDLEPEVYIRGYELDGPGGLIWKYTILFECASARQYGFTDRTGDTYWCTVHDVGRRHSINYNSDQPEITKVEALPL